MRNVLEIGINSMRTHIGYSINDNIPIIRYTKALFGNRFEKQKFNKNQKKILSNDIINMVRNALTLSMTFEYIQHTQP